MKVTRYDDNNKLHSLFILIRIKKTFIFKATKFFKMTKSFLNRDDNILLVLKPIYKYQMTNQQFFKARKNI